MFLFFVYDPLLMQQIIFVFYCALSIYKSHIKTQCCCSAVHLDMVYHGTTTEFFTFSTIFGACIILRVFQLVKMAATLLVIMELFDPIISNLYTFFFKNVLPLLLSSSGIQFHPEP